MSEPRRRVLITLELGSDSIEDAVRTLHHIATEAGRLGLTNCVSGGYDTGYVLKIDEDPAITHDSYFEALQPVIESYRTLGHPDAPGPAAGAIGGEREEPAQ